MTPLPASSQPRLAAKPGVADVDASLRHVALLFTAKSVFWLLAGSLLLLLASVKLHAPAMMSKAAWLTYGRLAPAGWDLLVYGFVGQAAFAIGLWLLARASLQRLQAPQLVLAGGVLWNIGVLVGTVGILAGYSTGRELLEMPAGALVCMVVGAGLIGSSGWMTFAARTQPETYPSAWFILLALISFVWFGSVALMMFSGDGVHGVVQVLVQRWYANGILKLWLGGIGLGLIFHALPLALNRPLASRSLALIAFWSLALFSPWAITTHGDPFPRWMVAAGIAGQFLATIGLLANALNWWKTSEGASGALLASPQGRLIKVAALSYIVGGVIQFALAFRGVSASYRFTWIQPGLDWLLIGGGVALALFALLPEFIHRATGRSLDSNLVRVHALLSLVGILIIAVSLLVGGWIQGARFADTSLSALDVLRSSMHLVRLSTLGLVLFLLGQVTLLIAFLGIFRSMAAEILTTVKAWAVPTGSGRAAEVRS